MVTQSKTQRRTQPWFGEFRTSVRVYIKEATALRTLDHAYISQVLERRRSWGRRLNKPNFGGSWRNNWHAIEITDEIENDLYSMCDFLLGHHSARRIQIYGDWIYIYTNDKRIIDDLEAQPFANRRFPLLVTFCVDKGQPNSVCVKNPQNKWRTYFKSRRLNDNQANSLKKYLVQLQEVRLGPALKTWAHDETSFSYLHDYFFIDHNEEHTLSMIPLILPGIIRKTVPIVQDK